MHSFDWLFFIVLVIGSLLSIVSGRLTVSGGITGGAIALCVFVGTGYAGIIMLAVFFILGSAATSFKINMKRNFGYAKKGSEKRTAGQVFANGGVAAIAGLLILIIPLQENMLTLMLSASLASATADTLSSELGTVYGSRFYNIVTFKKDTRGLDGVISAEGTVIGIFGCTIIATIYSFYFGWDSNFFVIIIAGTIGNITDSFLGASLERKKYLQNNMVNFINTLLAALCVLLWQGFAL